MFAVVVGTSGLTEDDFAGDSIVARDVSAPSWRAGISR